MCFRGFGRLSLQLNANILLLRLLPEPLVLFDALKEVIPALGMAQMFDTHVDPLGDDASAHPLVHDHSQGVRRHVEHTTGLAVIDFVRHTLLHRTVSLDVHDIADLIRLHVRGQGDGSMLAELAGEQVPGATSVTLRVGHGDVLSYNKKHKFVCRFAQAKS